MTVDGTRSIATGKYVTTTGESDIGPVDDIRIDKWELEASRRILANLRNLLYGRPMNELIADQVAASTKRYKAYSDASDGQFRRGQVMMRVKGVKTAQLVSVVQKILTEGEGTADQRRTIATDFMFPIHPEHYTLSEGEQGGVIETMGGSPTLTLMNRLDEATAPDFVTQFIDPAYPMRSIGAGMLDDGATVQSYVLQQFRDTEEGLEENLRIWYPAASPASDIEEHLRHYAVESRGACRAAAGWAEIQTTASTDLGDVDDTGIDEWELAASRRALANLRNRLYGKQMSDLIADQVSASTKRYQDAADASGGSFKQGHVRLTCEGMTLAEYGGMAGMVNNVEAGSSEGLHELNRNLMFPMHPEHYEFGSYDGHAGGVETMGGSPTLTYVSYIDTEEAPDYITEFLDPSFPLQHVGGGVLDNGTRQTYVLQQFKDSDKGLVIDLRVWYPSTVPDADITEHVQHYAVEFRNGVRMAAGIAHPDDPDLN